MTDRRRAVEIARQLPDAEAAFVAVGGARVPATLLERAHALGIPAYEGYGLSECHSVVALNTPGACRAGSVGRVLPHVRVEVAADGDGDAVDSEAVWDFYRCDVVTPAST